MPMHDMLVRLYRLPDTAEPLRRLAEQGIRVRLCRPYEAHILESWVEERFSRRWMSEVRVAMSHRPPGCLVATRQGSIIGFACFDATARGFIGPMGVDVKYRGGGVGRALLLASCEQMYALGYAYAAIGGVGPADFYSKAVGAMVIPDSSPGIYEDILPENP